MARPDSMMDGISVYETRLNMGESLADKITTTMRHLDIDVVIPIPDSSRPSALQLANRLGVEFPRRLRQESLYRPDLHHAGAAATP